MRLESSLPLVSIGVPTFNRPQSLRKALESIIKQTYENLEIIISDNCSDNYEVQKVIKEFILIDSRIKAYKQDINIGAMNNFKFVLEKSSGKYFMWASDNDIWTNRFIEKTVKFLETNDDYIAVSMEAQYFDDKLFYYFPEGRKFYNFFSENKVERLRFILKYSYGNLIYGLFKKSIFNNVLFSYNEIPFFLQVFVCGNWKVLSEIGLYKKAPYRVYQQAKWEANGGILFQNYNHKIVRNTISSYKYHKIAYKDILNSINTLPIEKSNKIKLKNDLIINLTMHFFHLLLGIKRKQKYIIVKILGGLGNQMFQYAYAKALQQKGHKVKIDIGAFLNYRKHGGYQLDRYNIDLSTINLKEKNFLIKIKNKLGKKILYETKLEYNNQYLTPKNGVNINGYFQSEKYFLDIRDIIIQNFQIKNELSSYTKQIEKEILSIEDSVSVHIRRGDYISDKTTNHIHGVCNLKYYNKAINLLNNKFHNIKYFIFSDDIKWCEENLKIYNAVYIDNGEKRIPHEDIYLMSLCNHNIIANSSFSWWGAWLNKSSNKIVVAPRRWFVDNELEKQSKDIVCEDWIRI